MNQVPRVDSRIDSLNLPRRLRDILLADRLVPGRILLPGLAGVALLAYTLTVLLGPILREADTYMSFSHLYIWTAALRSGDLLSTWTPIDANGFGSPVPFFYNKLINLIGAALALLSGDLVMGYRLATLVFAAIMFAGVYTCAGRFGADRISRLVMAALSVLAPYLINKLLAGSVAEYSGATLVPFIVALAIDAYAGRFAERFGVWRGVALFVLLLLLSIAHVLVFVIAAGVLFVAMLYLLITAPRRGALPFAATLGALAVFVALIYVPFSYWSTYFCSKQANYFGPIANLLISPRDILWRSPRSSFNWPVFALIIAMVVTLVRFRRITDRRTRTAFALGCVTFGVIFMMTRFARPFWLISGPLEFMQFPWRLLSVAIPVCMVALAGLIEQFPLATKRRIQLLLLVFAMVTTVRVLNFSYHETDAIPGPQLRREVPTTSVVGPDAGGEYLPAVYQQRLSRINLWTTRVTTVLPAQRPLIEASGCVYTDIPRSAYFDTLRISATCTAGGRLRVNQFATPFLESSAVGGDGRTLQPVAGTEFIEFALPPGHWDVVVRKQSYLGLVLMAWRARLSAHGL